MSFYINRRNIPAAVEDKNASFSISPLSACRRQHLSQGKMGNRPQINYIGKARVYRRRAKI